jgi:hypothetical protein
MTAYSRQGNKWTINEMLSLQREYEFLEMTIQQIAEKHQRSETSILYKLESEGLIDSWNSARGFDSKKYQKSVTTNKKTSTTNKKTSTQEEDEDDEDYYGGDDNNDEDYQFEEESDDDEMSENDDDKVNELTERVWSLETSVSEISSMVKNIYGILSAKQTATKKTKAKPLRTHSSV